MEKNNQSDLVTNNKEDIKNYSSSVVLHAKKEVETVYKRTTYFFAITTMLLLAILVVILPLKKDVPFVLKVDSYLNAGELTMLKSPHEYTENETVRLASVNNYIKSYEDYSIFNIENQLALIKASSENQVFNNFELAVYKSHNNLLDTLGKETTIETEIESIIELAKTHDVKDFEGHTVYNYDVKIKKNYIKNGTVNNVKKYRILISFIYKEDNLLTIKERLVNPLNMYVINYKSAEITTE